MGHVEAICRQIEEEESFHKSIEELTLDQNNITDLSFSKILTSILSQARNLEYIIKTINYSNNELGPRSIAVLDNLINLTIFNSLSDLKLSNLRMSESSISLLFEALSKNYTLNKIRISGIHLGNTRKITLLTQSLRENRTLAELDLSWAGLTLRQQVLIYTELKDNNSIRSLNMAYNTFPKLVKRAEEYKEEARETEERELSERLLDILKDLIGDCDKLMHLDLTGCNLGRRISDLAPALGKSVSLQAVHLSQNEIPNDVKEELFNRMNINKHTRMTRPQI